jgi:hypothetical protein
MLEPKIRMETITKSTGYPQMAKIAPPTIGPII